MIIATFAIMLITNPGEWLLFTILLSKEEAKHDLGKRILDSY